MIDSIGFDLDGTLWDFTPMVEACWKASFARESLPLNAPSLEMIRSNAGLMPEEYLPAYLPEIADPEERMGVFERAMAGVYDRILETGGILYPGVQEMLRTLSSRYKLFIASNCETLYLQNFLRHYHFFDLFDGAICFGLTGKNKGESIRLLAEERGYRRMVFVGDTRGDMDAAAAAGAEFVHASYGFGRVPDARHAIRTPDELITLLERL